MFTNDPAALSAELEYRQSRNRRTFAAARGARTRSAWVRRIAAAERTPTSRG